MKRGLFGLAILWLALWSPVRAQTPQYEPIRCVVAVSTAVTIPAVGAPCAATPNMALNITDILFATNAAGIAADSFNTLKYGTGTTCGTGTTVLWGAFTAAATQATNVMHFVTPLKLPQNVDLCWINSTAGSKFLVLSGFLSP